MRELIFNTGGRKLFNEDLGDLQDQIRAAESLFLGEEPFVISGFIFTGSTGAYNISEGYLWLGGKIIKVDETTAFDENAAPAFYINASDVVDEETEYDDNTDKVSTKVYGYGLGITPSDTDPINNSLRIDDIPNIRRYFDNVLGDKYVLKDSGQTQVIANNLSLTGATIVSDADISTTAKVTAAAIDVTNGNLRVINGNLSVGSGSIFALNGIVGDEFYTINGLSLIHI